MNEESRSKILEFTDLKAWQESHRLVLLIYQFTKKFPKEESYGLVSQMRRAAVSITSNIAEGFGRQGYKEKIQFYYLAHGSLIELKNQLIVAHDVGYIDEGVFQSAVQQSSIAHRLLRGLITKSKSFVIHHS
ncbi:MAG: four helix bundle protein [Patescibacteria group bacterium]